MIRIWDVWGPTVFCSLFIHSLCGAAGLNHLRSSSADDEQTIGKALAPGYRNDADWDREESSLLLRSDPLNSDVPSPPWSAVAGLLRSSGDAGDLPFIGIDGDDDSSELPFSKALSRFGIKKESCETESIWISIPDSLRKTDQEDVFETSKQLINVQLIFISRNNINQCRPSAITDVGYDDKVGSLWDDGTNQHATRENVLRTIDEIFLADQKPETVGLIYDPVPILYSFVDSHGLSAYVSTGRLISSEVGKEDAITEQKQNVNEPVPSATFQRIIADSVATIDLHNRVLSFVNDHGSLQFVPLRSPMDEVNGNNVGDWERGGDRDVSTHNKQSSASDPTTFWILPTSQLAQGSPEIAFKVMAPIVLPTGGARYDVMVPAVNQLSFSLVIKDDEIMSVSSVESSKSVEDQENIELEGKIVQAIQEASYIKRRGDNFLAILFNRNPPEVILQRSMISTDVESRLQVQQDRRVVNETQPLQQGVEMIPNMKGSTNHHASMTPTDINLTDSDQESTTDGNTSADVDNLLVENHIHIPEASESEQSYGQATPVDSTMDPPIDGYAAATPGLATCLSVRRYGIVEASYQSAEKPKETLFDSIKFPVILSVQGKARTIENGQDDVNLDQWTEGNFQCTLQAATTTSFDVAVSSKGTTVSNITQAALGLTFMQPAENRLLTILNNLAEFHFSNAFVTLISHKGDTVLFTQRIDFMFSAAAQTVPTLLTLQRDVGQLSSNHPMATYRADLVAGNFHSFALSVANNGTAQAFDFYHMNVPTGPAISHITEVEAYILAVFTELESISTQRCEATFSGREGQLRFFESLIDQPTVWRHRGTVPAGLLNGGTGLLHGGIAIGEVYLSMEFVRPNDERNPNDKNLTLSGRLQTSNVYEFNLIPRYERIVVDQVRKISQQILNVPDYLRELDFIRRFQSTINVTAGGIPYVQSISFSGPLTSIEFRRLSRFVELDPLNLGHIADNGTSWQYRAQESTSGLISGAGLLDGSTTDAANSNSKVTWRIETLSSVKTDSVAGQAAIEEDIPMLLTTRLSDRQSPKGSTPSSYNLDVDGIITRQLSQTSHSSFVSEIGVPFQIQVLRDAMANAIIELPLIVGHASLAAEQDPNLLTALQSFESSSRICFHPGGDVTIGNASRELIKLHPVH